jgi:serine/threonine protein phosphatase PrpC
MDNHFFGLTDTGRVRTNNEDTFVTQQVLNGRYILAAVIDGVGGYDGGEIAAEIARSQFIEQLTTDSADVQQALAAAFEQANRQIYQRKQQDAQLKEMACVATAALIDIESNQFYYAHVGDTRLYLLRDQSLVKITQDHSFVGFLEDSGRLTETAAMQHPKRNEINKALGFHATLTNEKNYIETGQSPFLPGDVLLLCSDGLTDMVDKQEITSIISGDADLAAKCRSLIDTANRNGGRDNVTVVLVHNYKKPQQPQATMPVTNSVKPENTAAAEPKQQPLPPPVAPVLPAAEHKNHTGIITLLSVLCLVFLAAAGWFWWQAQQQKPQPVTQAVTPVKKQRNAQEQKLQDTINSLKGDTLSITAATFGQPVSLSDTLKINKDTLLMKGNLVLQRNTSYTGPAIVLGPACKLIVLNGVTINGFNTGITAVNTALQLQHVHFLNCVYPVQVNYAFTSTQAVSTRIPALLYIADTASTTTSKPLHGTKR